MYARSARFYDAIYSWKDYPGEANQLTELIHHRNIGARSLLDVACGSGKHLSLLRDRFVCEGLDFDATFVKLARERNPGVIIHQGDFRDFDLGRTFDAVTCLFSAIGYAETEEGLQKAIRCMARHVAVGGVLIVEPWLYPEEYLDGTLHKLFVDLPDIKISRMNVALREGQKSIMDMHHLVGTSDGVEHFVERHELTMFTHGQYLKAFEEAGLATDYDSDGLTGRGLFIGTRTN